VLGRPVQHGEGVAGPPTCPVVFALLQPVQFVNDDDRDEKVDGIVEYADHGCKVDLLQLVRVSDAHTGLRHHEYAGSRPTTDVPLQRGARDRERGDALVQLVVGQAIDDARLQFGVLRRGAGGRQQQLRLVSTSRSRSAALIWSCSRTASPTQSK
jgi:hypothetical protein